MTLATKKYPFRISGVLFDLDGTLIDSAIDLAAAANLMRQQRKLEPLPLAHYRPHVGSGARGLLAQAFGVSTIDPNFEILKEEFLNNYQACLTQEAQFFDGVPELIKHLNEHKIVWGIVTNKAARFTDIIVRNTPLLTHAATVISGDTTAHAKPHPAPLLEAASRIGIAPAHCAYIGDDERDIIAGHAAGMYTIAAAYGYLGENADIAQWNAHNTINYPLALLQILTCV